MGCESWNAKLDAYLDGELPSEEMRGLDAHLRGCASCSADALSRVQMKRTIQAAGKRFTPSPEFREQLRQSIAPKRGLHLQWLVAAAAVAVLVAGALLTSSYLGVRANRNHVFSEIADLHVET